MATTFIRRTFAALVGFRRQIFGPSAEARSARNLAIAKLAYGLAYCDGVVHPLERQALAEVVMRVYPWVDQAEIVRLFDNLAYLYPAGSGARVLTPEVIAGLPATLFVEDYVHVPVLMRRIAEAHEGVAPAEAMLIQQVTAALTRAGVIAPTAQA